MIWLFIAIVAVCLTAAAIAFLSSRSEPADPWTPIEEERSEDWEFPPRNEGSTE